MGDCPWSGLSLSAAAVAGDERVQNVQQADSRGEVRMPLTHVHVLVRDEVRMPLTHELSWV